MNMIEVEEMREITKRYKDPLITILGSHSALDIRSGARNYGLRSLIYTTKARAIIYLQNLIAGKPGEYIEDIPSIARRDVVVVNDVKDINKNKDWNLAILVLDRYDEILKFVDDLIELEAIQIPNRAFSVYVGGDSYCSKIEKEFSVPILGSRKLLKVENRGEIEKDYYWYAEKAGIPTPRAFKFEVYSSGIKFNEKIDEPLLLKAENARRKFERTFIFASDSIDLEEKVEKEIKAGNLNEEGLSSARVEQIVLGPHANFNFFFSPIDAKEEWGAVDDAFSKLYSVSIEDSRTCLANELLSIDERRESILDGVKRLPVEVQRKIEERLTPSFEVTFHSMISIRESLIKDVLINANKLLLTLRKYEPPGIIGAWCLQTLVTWDKVSKYNYKPQIKFDFSVAEGKKFEDYGLYDSSQDEVYMHIPVTQDVALRHGGGTNVHMGIGAQYSNIKYQRTMSLGDRTALEVKRALKRKVLELLVT